VAPRRGCEGVERLPDSPLAPKRAGILEFGQVVEMGAHV
jgi:hypothetical protein